MEGVIKVRISERLKPFIDEILESRPDLEGYPSAFIFEACRLAALQLRHSKSSRIEKEVKSEVYITEVEHPKVELIEANDSDF